MRRGIRCAVIIGGLCLVQAASASADVLCVPNNTIPGCPTNTGLSEPTISDATTNGQSGDTILIAAGTYTESVTDNGKSFTFVGAGPTKTLIQAQGSPGMNLSSGSKAFNFGIEVAPTSGNTGLQLAGTATNVAITAQSGVTYAIGVDLLGGTFRHGSVSLPVQVSEPQGFAGVVGSGTVSDSTITAAVGVGPDGVGQTPRVTRDRILANQGVQVGGTGSVVEDSLIRTVPGPVSELGVGTSPFTIFGSFTVRHCTIVGSQSAGSTGVFATSSGVIGPAITTVLIDSSIIRGYGRSISASAISNPFPATTTVTVHYSIYDPTTSHTSATGTSADAKVNPDSHSGNHNPLFVNPGAGNFQLRAGSPAIDAGSPTLESGESTTDLAGNPRRLIGRKGDAAIPDGGAYEFRHHVPTVHVTASKLHVTVGQRVRFHAAGSDASPGDALSFRWSFGGKSSTLGPTVSHAFHTRGKHTVRVVVTDLDRYSSSASIIVTVRRRRH
jgi:hypothetical protein